MVYRSFLRYVNYPKTEMIAGFLDITTYIIYGWRDGFKDIVTK